MMPTRYEVIKGCTFCGTCINECPVSAIKMDWQKGAVIDQEKCIGCGTCYENCASEAIERFTQERKEEKS